MGFLDATGVTELVTKLKTKFAAIAHTHTSSDLPIASTSAYGIVQLNDATNSSSTSTAATASAVNTAWEKAMYGTSSTTASTATKIISCSSYSLVEGQLIAIQFSTANTYKSGAIALNINYRGAKNVYVNGAVTSSTNTLLWDANETLLFVYTGSYYYYITKSKTMPVVATNAPSDLNNLTETGVYYYSSSSTNHPTATNGTVIVLRTSDTYVYQMAFPNNSSGNLGVYVRMKYSSSSWSSWNNLVA